MKKLALLLALVPGLALSQVAASASFRIDLPVVLPQLVVVQPGIQVVPDVDAEVFFVNGFYWVRDDGGWYRSRNHRGGWAFVEPRRVPPGLVRIPPGQYKKYHHRPAPAAYRGEGSYKVKAKDGGFEVKSKGEKHGKGRGGKHGRD